MSSTGNFQEKSYKQHSEHFDDHSPGGKQESHAKTWFENDTVDAWRHQRMYRILNPLLTADPKARWLTVGDGRYGKDAKYILEKGCDALATDISDSLLKVAKDIGYITKYQKENAESLTFKDAEFEYVFCKESYHHFPRPMVALYEMLRVANNGIVLVEPNDAYIVNSFSAIVFRNVKSVVKIFLGKKSNKHTFEESGNYLFSISRREVEKVALGLDLKVVAYLGINDAYFKGVEYEKLSSKGPLQRKVRILIGIQNLLCRLRLMDYGLLGVIIFKKEPSKDLLQLLLDDGYEVVQLPNNPYIND